MTLEPCVFSLPACFVCFIQAGSQYRPGLCTFDDLGRQVANVRRWVP